MIVLLLWVIVITLVVIAAILNNIDHNLCELAKTIEKRGKDNDL